VRAREREREREREGGGEKARKRKRETRGGERETRKAVSYQSNIPYIDLATVSVLPTVCTRFPCTCTPAGLRRTGASEFSLPKDINGY